MSRRECKFCHCTERRACRLVAVMLPGVDPYILPPGIALVPPGADAQIVPCEWAFPGICSNPACVERAYLEARELALQLEAA